MTITLALDAMGGDNAPGIVLDAALAALDQHPSLHLILVGREDMLLDELARRQVTAHERLRVHHASEVVAMDESPALALRSKKDSSMRVAINLVRDGVAQACVSAGNTGALMATAKFVLKTLPGIDRPAICARIPTATPLPTWATGTARARAARGSCEGWSDTRESGAGRRRSAGVPAS